MTRWLLFLVLLYPFNGIAQQYKPVSLSLSEGLSQSSVYEIIQDKSGFTWMATQDGLNKFDGNQFSVFRDEPFDTNSISSNFINDLLCDSKGRIWIGTANHGLNLLLPGKNSFLRFKAGNGKSKLSSNIITDIYEDGNGVVWVGTGNGLLKVEEKAESGKSNFQFTRVPLFTTVDDTIGDKFINVIKSDAKNQIWVGTFSGLFKIDNNNKNIDKNSVRWFGKSLNQLADFVVNTITIDHANRIWVGGIHGIDIFDQSGAHLLNLQKEGNGQTGMISNSVKKLFTASSGDIWVGYNESGLQIVKTTPPGEPFVFERPQLSNSSSIVNNGTVLSLWEDKITKGIIWAGFNAGGAVRLVPVMKKFVTNNLSNAPLNSAFVINILADTRKNIWIGTPSGLLKYQHNSKLYQTFLPSLLRKKPFSDNYISGLVYAPDGSVLFGSGTDLFHVSTKAGKEIINSIAIPEYKTKNKNALRTIVSDNNGKIFLVMRYCIYQFIPDSGMLKTVVKITDEELLNDKGFYISSCFLDHAGNFWVGTSSGLDFYAAGTSFDKTEPISYKHNGSDTTSLRNQNILCIAEDKNNNIWLGTLNGLTRVINKNGKKTFLNYSTKNGLKNNVVYSILTDSKTGNLWLSTNNGLTEFNPEGKAIANYDEHDGLQSNEFNSYAAFKTGDGEFYFGGIAGYTSFYPEQILTDPTLPSIVISNVVLNDNRVINLAGNDQEKIVDLKYRDNSFTVNFTGLHYVDPQKIQYAYMLEGFQSDWTYAGNLNRVNFSQLPPGRYVFKVKASNSDGIYNEAGDKFIINIDPPFHKTIWFYLLLAAIVSGIVYGLFRWRLQMKMEQVKEVEQLRRETAADFHDELGHKLTIISWFAEILKKKIGPEQQELRPHLDRIIEASGNLYHTMKDMLWAMDPDKDSVFDLYSQIKEFGLELFDNTGVEFEAAEIPPSLKEHIISPVHKRHVLLIFKEVMHNSLKHASGNATTLDFDATKEFIRFRFRDNGKGFKMNGQSVGRGLENVKRRAKQIHAAINIHSEGTGTVAELDIPLEQLN